MIDRFLKGAIFMYPLTVCSLVSLTVILEKAEQLWQVRADRAQTEAVLLAASAGSPRSSLRLPSP